MRQPVKQPRPSYMVKEIFATLQGEGINAGRAAVFCRFSGCNLWSGREEDRSTAVCQFCDTDFVGGERYYGAFPLGAAIEAAWKGGRSDRLVVLTGGEPLLQVDAHLVASLRQRGFETAVETNGTIHPPAGINWICVSPKAGTDLLVDRGNELKLVYPQAGIDPARYRHLIFDHFLLSPMDGPEREANTAACVAYCLAHPQWRLSLQTHKWIGIR